MAENAVRIPRFQPLVLADAHAQYFRHLALGQTLLLPGLLQIPSHDFLHSNLGRMAGRAGFEPAREKGCKAAVSSPRSDLESAAIDRSATAPRFFSRRMLRHGATGGNRTRFVGLEGRCSTNEPLPQIGNH